MTRFDSSLTSLTVMPVTDRIPKVFYNNVLSLRSNQKSEKLQVCDTTHATAVPYLIKCAIVHYHNYPFRVCV